MTAHSPDSINRWIEDLRQGDGDAAQFLWDGYFQRVVHLAARHLGHAPRGAADEEDIAACVFENLYRGIAEGRFSDLANGDDLWRMLVELTHCHVVDFVRRAQRQKRGGSSDSLPESADQIDIAASLKNHPSGELSPDRLLSSDEEFQRLLALLQDDSLRSIARWKLDGSTHAEIAERLRITIRTVDRKLRLIRIVWKQELLR